MVGFPKPTLGRLVMEHSEPAFSPWQLCEEAKRLGCDLSDSPPRARIIPRSLPGSVHLGRLKVNPHPLPDRDFYILRLGINTSFFFPLFRF